MASARSSRPTDPAKPRVRRAVWLLPVVAGLFATASFPRLSLSSLAWVALVPLLVFVGQSPRARRAFGGGVLFGGALAFPMLRWIPRVLSRYGGVGAPLAWALYAGLIALFACFPAAVCAYTYAIRRRLGPVALVAFAPAWVAMELARNYVIFDGF